MRLRWQRRVGKQLRRMRDQDRTLATAVAKLERGGIPLAGALRAIMLDRARFHQECAASGKLLAVAGGGEAVRALMGLFFEQTEKDDLYATALTIESLNDRHAVPRLIGSLLHDDNPHRRHAATRALGWIRQPGRAATLALAHSLVDAAQPQPAREEAAESLAYVGTRETIESLISVLRDPDVSSDWAAVAAGTFGPFKPWNLYWTTARCRLAIGGRWVRKHSRCSPNNSQRGITKRSYQPKCNASSRTRMPPLRIAAGQNGV
jgi:hypothetical protein